MLLLLKKGKSNQLKTCYNKYIEKGRLLWQKSEY